MATTRGDASRFTRSTKAIVVADVVESVRLMEQDEHEFILRWQRFVDFVQGRLAQASGRLHKSLGDGLMLEFSDPAGCLPTAAAMLSWCAQANEALAPEDHVQLRVGAHMADFVADEYDIYGTDVNLAARISSLAGPGEIVISAALRARLDPEVQEQLEDLGICHLKHVKEPVHAFRMGQAGHAPVIPARRPPAHGLRPILAVLPFGMQGDAGGITGEAVADDFVAALTHSQQLQVVSRMTTAPLSGRPSIRDELRRLVGTHYTLTGRARRRGGHLSLFVELADAHSGHVAWAQHFQGPTREAELLDGSLRREIVTSVHSAAIGHEVMRARGQALHSLEGPTLLLASIGLMHRLSTPDLERAQAMLEHLADRWRSHPAPHAWLAHLHVLRLAQGGPGEAAADARAARERALLAVRCDSGSAQAQAMQAQAWLHAAGNLRSAEDCLAMALAIDANDSLALLVQGELWALQGDGTAAWASVLRARDGMALEVMRYLYDHVSALAAVAAGDPVAAALLAERSLRRNPAYLPAMRTMVVAQVLCGDLPKARIGARRLLERQPAFEVPRLLAAWPAQPKMAQTFADALRQAGLPG